MKTIHKMFQPLARKNINNKIHIMDSTLRDGEQAPGVVFTLKEKMKIALFLDAIGIDEIEAGSPFMGEQEEEAIRSIVKQSFHYRISCWSRAKYSDIDAAARTGAEGINISFPVSDIQLNALNLDRSWVFNSMDKIVTYAGARFKYVSLGAQDASRADFNMLAAYLKKAIQLNVSRVRIADTVGILNPITVNQLFRKLCKAIGNIPVDLEFHGHNDLGMASANTLCALQSGANWASVTVNGLGERSGNAALEEVIMALKHSCSYPLQYNTTYFNALSQIVSQASQRPIPVSKPVVGEMTHKHESGIHTHGLISDMRTYQPYSASEVGKTSSEFVFGIHSGSAGITQMHDPEKTGIGLAQLLSAIPKLKELAREQKKAFSTEELNLLLARKPLINPELL